jgi:hypothetical protein
MNRLLVFLIGSLFILAFALPAMAEVDVTATIDKTKDVTVTETIDKIKTVNINVTVDLAPEKAGESMTIGNQENNNNFACTNCAEKASIILNSVNGNTGLTNINQQAGNMANQGIAISVAVDVEDGGDGQQPPEAEGGFAEAQASVAQNMDTNEVQSTAILWRIADIENSINGNTGITNVNQATGNINNQMAGISLAVSLADGVALSEADLGQSNTNNSVREYESSGYGVNKNDSIASSVSGNTGITTVNQTCGNMNNQANIVSVASAIGL